MTGINVMAVFVAALVACFLSTAWYIVSRKHVGSSLLPPGRHEETPPLKMLSELIRSVLPAVLKCLVIYTGAVGVA